MTHRPHKVSIIVPVEGTEFFQVDGQVYRSVSHHYEFDPDDFEGMRLFVVEHEQRRTVTLARETRAK